MYTHSLLYMHVYIYQGLYFKSICLVHSVPIVYNAYTCSSNYCHSLLCCLVCMPVHVVYYSLPIAYLLASVPTLLCRCIHIHLPM